MTYRDTLQDSSSQASDPWHRPLGQDVRAGRPPGTRSAGVRLAVVLTVLVTVALSVSGPPVAASPSAAAASPSSGPPDLSNPPPVTGAYPNSMGGTLPPSNPPANIPPSPDFLSYCSGRSYDDSPSCLNSVLQAIDNARSQEGLSAMVLPTNWTALNPQQQLYVATNLERTVRGLPPLSGMAVALDQAAAQGAASNQDPTPPQGFPWSMWGSNWAAAVGNPLEAIYLWMYDDGEGSSNIDCTQNNTSGCWGHRDNILIGLRCSPCDMGVGFVPSAWQGYPSWTELLVDTYGNPGLDYAWSDVLPYLPGSPGGAGLYAPAVGVASTPDGNGYWLVDSAGGVFTFGDAQFYGSMAGSYLAAPVVAIASTEDGRGYWLVASDGGVFTFGDAKFFGSAGDIPLSRPMVGIAPTPDGNGYWLVAADGGIFTYGDAPFLGSTGAEVLNRPVVGMSPTPDGNGYWLVAADGGIFTFGDAPFLGSTGDIVLNRPVVGMSPTRDGNGYWLVAADGGIFTFGDAPFKGSTGNIALNAPMVSMAAPSSSGYWLAAADGGIFSFGLPFHGSMG